MANLLNKYIYETYKSIIGIGQSGTSGVSGTPQALTDGEGHELPIKVSETDVELGFTTTKNIFIEAYGEVIDQNGNWTGPTAGLAGTSGTSGHDGTSGTSGTSGYAGAAGSSGTSGTSGYNGSSGVAGTSGTSGTSGVSGTSGTSGVNGAPGTQNLIINNAAASIGAKLPSGNIWGVQNFSAPGTWIYQPDNAQDSIGIGYYGASFNNAIYIGHYGQAANDSIVLGHNSYAEDSTSNANTIIGQRSGVGAGSQGNNTIIGSDTYIYPGNNGNGNNNVFGTGSQVIGQYNNVMGSGLSVGANYAVVLGSNAINADYTTAIGYNNQVLAEGAIAIGRNLLAETVDTTTMRLLQLVDTVDKNFADDAAAAAGGIPVGGIYHTSGILKIRIA